MRCPSKLNSHNHNQHAGRPCFSLAVLIGSKRPVLARVFEDVFSFHLGFSAALENLRRVRNNSRTKPDASGGRFTSRHGSAAALRKSNIVVSIDMTKRHSCAGSSILLARKLHAGLWHMRRNCAARNVAKERTEETPTAAL